MNTAEERSKQVPLHKLIEGLVELPSPLPGAFAAPVSGVSMDSRQLHKGDLFIACFGRNHDAREYIDSAIKLGVSAVLAHAGGRWQGIELRQGVPVIAIENLAARISEIAARFYERPSTDVAVMGITGTNGKTSCSQFIAQLLNRSGEQCGVVGTLGYGLLDSLVESPLATPDAVFIQRLLAEFRREGVAAVAMEVSSVGLHQHRVGAVDFESAIFTNLSRDHLDYHDNMANYAENKRKLFARSGLKTAVINIDDAYGLFMADAVGRDVNVLTYSLTNPAASVYASDLKIDRHGLRASIHTPFGDGDIACRLFGRFNVSNVLAAITSTADYLSRQRTLNLAALFEDVSNIKPISGRMEMVGSSDEITCIVDYAHTPEGLRSALGAIRDHFTGQVWCVFGCGGNRDMGKRPLMGEIARFLADRVVITDDNPRKEDGAEIVQQILSGIEDSGAVQIIRDRARAIEYAVDHAEPGDIVLIAGKGHENYQDVGGVKSLFSDVNQVRLALQRRSQAGQVKGSGA